jgi:hypothetical protein
MEITKREAASLLGAVSQKATRFVDHCVRSSSSVTLGRGAWERWFLSAARATIERYIALDSLVIAYGALSWHGDVKLRRQDIDRLLRDAPSALAFLVQHDRLAVPTLTFVAEALGDLRDKVTAKRLLVRLLSHRSAVVREGAVYGLQNLVDDDVRAALRETAEGDVSPGVRAAAEEALDA